MSATWLNLRNITLSEISQACDHSLWNFTYYEMPRKGTFIWGIDEESRRNKDRGSQLCTGTWTQRVAGVVAQEVKPRSVHLHWSAWDCVLPQLPIQFPTYVHPGKEADDVSSAWIHAVHIGDQHGVPGFWLWPDPVLAVKDHYGVTQQYLSLSFK